MIAGVSVNVQVNNQTNNLSAIRPGDVLDLLALKDKPQTPDADPLTIDAEPCETDWEFGETSF